MLICFRQRLDRCPEATMQNSAYTFLVVPLIGWLSVVSLLVVAYLATLAIEERRRNRRMDQERERLGLRRA